MILATGGQKRVDLGRIDPTCPARWHGTKPAYAAGCRCVHAREANRIYEKRCREGRLAAALLDPTGTRRRVQGMWALGHTSGVIADAAPARLFASQVARFCTQLLITPHHRGLIVDVYARLSVRPGTSSRTRGRALAAGYPLPVQWGADIDDPNAVPDPLEPDEPQDGFVDEDAVELALSGAKVPLTDDELVAAVQIGTARGMAAEPLAALLLIDHRAVKRIAGGDVPPRLSSLVRRRLALVRSAA
jgi:hypothetical protein